MAAKRRLSREREEKRDQKKMREASRKLDAQAIIRRFRDTHLKADS